MHCKIISLRCKGLVNFIGCEEIQFEAKQCFLQRYRANVDKVSFCGTQRWTGCLKPLFDIYWVTEVIALSSLGPLYKIARSASVCACVRVRKVEFQSCFCVRRQAALSKIYVFYVVLERKSVRNNNFFCLFIF